MSTHITLDIETGPLAKEQLDCVKPNFKAAKNLRDPLKIAADIGEKDEKFYDDAALCPTSGRVLAMGYRVDGETFTLADDDEATMLRTWWSYWINNAPDSNHPPFDFNRGSRLVVFNGLDFDLPFLVNRSWIVGVEVPWCFLDLTYLERQNRIHDVMLIWNCRRYKRSFKSLHSIATAMGVGGKKRENSELFFKLFAEDREAALAHLRNDLLITEAVFSRMQAFTVGHQI